MCIRFPYRTTKPLYGIKLCYEKKNELETKLEIGSRKRTWSLTLKTVSIHTDLQELWTTLQI